MLNLLFLAEGANELDGIDFSSGLGIAIIIVAVLIGLVGIVSSVVSIILAVKYIKFNRTKNSSGLAGKDVARKLLDQNGLEKIKVKCTGSIMFGNSYSHYFHKIRLRRLTWKKDSLTSLAMAAQKTGLAVLDKENDPDMKERVRLIPLITFGPLAFIPLIIIGIVMDIILIATIGFPVFTIVATAAGFIFMIASLILQIKTLKTEVKAEHKAYEILRENQMATEEEIEDMKELFKLYNIEYINNIILAFLEIIYKVLVIIAKVVNSKNKSSSD